MQAFPVVKLRRTNIRIVHKVANTVGRVMTTGINIANKSSSSSHALQSQDQPELDARCTHLADPPRRQYSILDDKKLGNGRVNYA